MAVLPVFMHENIGVLRNYSLKIIVDFANESVIFISFRILGNIAMELIRQIRKAEQEAKAIIETAKVDAVQMGESWAVKRSEELAKAEDERKAAILAAVAKAEEAGTSEVEALMSQGEQSRNDIANKARTKIDSAVQKVVESIKAGN